LQYVDARDLAAFCVTLVARGTTGAFTATGPTTATGYVETIERVAAHVGPAGTRVVEVDPALVEARGLSASFALWSGPTSEAMLTMDNAKAVGHGLVTRPLESSVDDVVAWWGDREWPGHWLGEADERALLSADR
jgi:hypothetical protein